MQCPSVLWRPARLRYCWLASWVVSGERGLALGRLRAGAVRAGFGWLGSFRGVLALDGRGRDCPRMFSHRGACLARLCVGFGL